MQANGFETIALIGDLHGNWPATQAVDADIAARGIEKIWCLGDLVGKGPSSDRTMDWAMNRCQVILRGNWDEGIALKQFAKDDFYYSQLGEARMRALSELPLEHTLWMSGVHIRLIHGRPIMKELLHATDTPENLSPLFEGDPPFGTVIYADAHRAALRTLNCGYLANTGSVGNAMGVPAAHYAILRGLPGTARAPLDMTFVHVPYDVERAVRDCDGCALHNIGAYIHEILTGIYSRGADQRPCDKPTRTE